MHVQQIIASHPQIRGNTNDALIRCIEQCYACAQTCVSCADACLAEEMVGELRQCIRLDLDCADICATVGKIATRQTGSNGQLLVELLGVCATACDLCAGECNRHAKRHDHCRICAETCQQCRDACIEARQSIRKTR